MRGIFRIEPKVWNKENVGFFCRCVYSDRVYSDHCCDAAIAYCANCSKRSKPETAGFIEGCLSDMARRVGGGGGICENLMVLPLLRLCGDLWYNVLYNSAGYATGMITSGSFVVVVVVVALVVALDRDESSTGVGQSTVASSTNRKPKACGVCHEATPLTLKMCWRLEIW